MAEARIQNEHTDAKDISKDAPDGEKICVQGIIDFFFEKEDGVCLIDFKTDRYDDPLEILARYKSQLFYYEKALKKKYTDKKIEKYLYLLHCGMGQLHPMHLHQRNLEKSQIFLNL